MRATCQDYLVALPSAEMDDCPDSVFEYFAGKIDTLEQHLALSDQASVYIALYIRKQLTKFTSLTLAVPKSKAMEEMQKGIQSFAAAYIALKLPFCYSKTSPQLLILLHLQHKKSQTTRSAIKNSAMSLICIISIANFDKVRVLHWGCNWRWLLQITEGHGCQLIPTWVRMVVSAASIMSTSSCACNSL